MADEPAPALHDVMTQRGAMLPQPKIVNREPLPVRREGPDPGTPWEQAGTLPEGFVPGQVHTPDNSKYRRP
jgi:hypothetical protein